MARYIDADKLSPDCMFNKNGTKGFAISQSQVSNAPTADVQPVIHGEWFGTEQDGYSDGFPVYIAWKCSNCGAEFGCEDMDFHYCPNCGAKMDLKGSIAFADKSGLEFADNPTTLDYAT